MARREGVEEGGALLTMSTGARLRATAFSLMAVAFLLWVGAWSLAYIRAGEAEAVWDRLLSTSSELLDNPAFNPGGDLSIEEATAEALAERQAARDQKRRAFSIGTGGVLVLTGAAWVLWRKRRAQRTKG